MWTAFLIIGAFFAAVLAIGYFAVQEGGERLGGEAPEPAGEGFGGASRAATSDQAVFEIEHRIHADLREVTHALRSPSDRFQEALRA